MFIMFEVEIVIIFMLGMNFYYDVRKEGFCGDFLLDVGG